MCVCDVFFEMCMVVLCVVVRKWVYVRVFPCDCFVSVCECDFVFFWLYVCVVYCVSVDWYVVMCM